MANSHQFYVFWFQFRVPNMYGFFFFLFWDKCICESYHYAEKTVLVLVKTDFIDTS